MSNYARFPDGKTRRVLYDHGLPFSLILAINIMDIILKIKQKKASILIIDGVAGQGKTTLGVHVLDFASRVFTMSIDELTWLCSLKTTELLEKLPALIKKLSDIPEVELIEDCPQIAMGGKDFQTKILKCFKQGLHVIVYDEAGDFSKKSTLTKFNYQLSRLWDTYRAFEILPIVILPQFNEMDESLFKKGIPELLVHCYGKTMDDGDFRGYDQDAMHYLKKWMKKGDYPPKHLYFKVWHNFIGHTLRLPPKREKQLDNISIKAKYEANKRQAIALSGYVSYEDIARNCHRSVSWVRKQAKEMKLKHRDTLDKRKYFDKNVIRQFQHRIDEKK